MKNVQAIIESIHFPKTLDELRWFMYDHGCFSVEDVIFKTPAVVWAVPDWIRAGDVVFFMHAKAAIQRIVHLEAMIREEYSINDRFMLMEALRRAKIIYGLYGGKIYAVGRVSDKPFSEDAPEAEKYKTHRKGELFAETEDICVLGRTVPVSDFPEFMTVSRQSAVTPVPGEAYAKLRDLIASKNEIPDFLKYSVATPLPLREINKENWMNLAQADRRAFRLEMQFRKFYADYLLRQLGDVKTFYRECQCYQNGEPSGVADYGIRLNGKICFAKVRLNFSTESEPALKEQLRKYCQVEKAEVSKYLEAEAEEIVQDCVLVMDTEWFGVYDGKADKITILAVLDEIRTAENIDMLRQQVLDFVF